MSSDLVGHHASVALSGLLAIALLASWAAREAPKPDALPTIPAGEVRGPSEHLDGSVQDPPAIGLAEIALPEPPPQDRVEPDIVATVDAPPLQAAIDALRTGPDDTKPTSVDLTASGPTGDAAPVKTARSIGPVEPSSAPAPVQAPTIERDRKVARSGRVLLHLLENGAGPSIEIAWPAGAAAREKLARMLHQCHGMIPAVLGADGGMFRSKGEPGQVRAIDLDRVSGFVRQPTGALTRFERGHLDAIERRHGPVNGRFVRLFDRTVDAALLGGLARLTGDQYRSRSSITAHYELLDDRVSIARIRADGRDIPGRIMLPGLGGCRSRA